VIDSVEDAGESHTIFTISFSALKAVRTSRKTWSGSATYATWPPTGADQATIECWDYSGWQVGSWDSSFERRFRLLYLSDGAVRIVAVEDVIVLE
jgi:hypothetical protein